MRSLREETSLRVGTGIGEVEEIQRALEALDRANAQLAHAV
jgi:hypothetical protein